MLKEPSATDCVIRYLARIRDAGSNQDLAACSFRQSTRHTMAELRIRCVIRVTSFAFAMSQSSIAPRAHRDGAALRSGDGAARNLRTERARAVSGNRQ
jgi:hypothetical protein